jgi:hypothetical protein
MLVRFLNKIFDRVSREPDFVIGPSKDDPYMERWWVIPRNKVFNIYRHEMLHDDDDRALHDHPWWSLSLCLKGVLIEHYLDGDYEAVRVIRPGRWVFRNGKFAHRLVVPHGNARTLFITGPRFRVWGFHCPKGWIPFYEFVKKDDEGSVGRGCGEVDGSSEEQKI